jgi:cell division protein FtsI (penicillin-binding protein 3)
VARIDRRIGILFATFVVLLAIAMVRAAYLGTVQAASLQQQAAAQHVVDEPLRALRGAITDRNGVELAISAAAYDIVSDNYQIHDPQTLARQLAPLLGQSPVSLLVKLTKHNGGVSLATHVPAPQVAAVKAAVKHLGIVGLTFAPDTVRIYPRSWTASQVIGSVHGDGHGASGLEYFYDQVLGGVDGIRRVVYDRKGQPISIDELRQTQPGNTVRLTIDAALQEEVEQVLTGVGAQFSPKAATAIVMDPNTGQILALANWPRVNANDPSGAPLGATRNLPVLFNYEPGSTFKAITIAGALQDGMVTPGTVFHVPAVLQVADRKIHDAESHGDEHLSVRDILKYSSNIGADEIGLALGKQRFDYWVHHFGFGAPTGVGLPGEQQGLVLHWQQYSGSSMGNLPIGQGESVTLMQMATAYSAIANGGILRPPRIVEAIGSRAVAAAAGRRVISPVVASDLRTMLQGVYADGGTASGARIHGYDMAGKTGTANVVVGNHYSSTRYIASFIGMVPTNHPRLLAAVMVDEPQGSIYGGQVAAPAFAKIIGWAVPYFGISPQ